MISDNDFFKIVTDALFKDLEEEQALINTTNVLGQYMPVDVISLSKYLVEEHVLITMASNQASQGDSLVERIHLPSDKKADALKTMSELEGSRIINDVTKLPDVFGFAFSRYIPRECSLIRLKLSWGANHLGSLLIHAVGKNRFTAEHFRLLNLLHDPFAMATANILWREEIGKLQDLLKTENKTLKEELQKATGGHIIGSELGLKDVMTMVKQVAPTNSSALLLGETGVGKELIANAIHRLSNRRDKPFIKFNCGAIPLSLVDSELFGHEKGAFTGATKRQLGRFERAHGGTIFLDEVGELPQSAQVRLLRVLQSKEFERVGGTETLTADTRIIAATNRDLKAMIQEGTFREDLFFRINVFPIKIPPLRERLNDLPALVDYFIIKKIESLHLHKHYTPAPDALENMMTYAWPGNVRELENVVEREIIRASSNKDEKHIHFFARSMGGSPQKEPMPSEVILTMDQAMARHIKTALIKARGRIEGVGGAAEILNMKPGTLRSRMRKIGVRFGRTNSRKS